MTGWTPALAQEAFDQASAAVEIELAPGVRLDDLEGAPEAFDAGVWFGMAATLDVADRAGLIDLDRGEGG